MQMSGSSTPLHVLSVDDVVVDVDVDVEGTVDVLDVLGVVEVDEKEVVGMSPHIPGHSNLMVGPMMLFEQKLTW